MHVTQSLRSQLNMVRVSLCILYLCGLMIGAQALVSPESITRIRPYENNFTEAVRNTSNSTSKVSKRCQNAFVALAGPHEQGLLGKLIDASGKPGSGVKDGNIAWFGAFSQCQSITQAHYCLADVLLKASNTTPNVPGKWGLCIPKNCSESDLYYGLEEILDMLPALKKYVSITTAFQYPPQPTAVVCAKPSPYTSATVATLTLCGALLLLCLLGTITEIVEDYTEPRNEIGDSGTFRNGPPVANERCFSDSDKTSINQGSGVIDENAPLILKTKKQNQSMLLEFLLCFSLIRNTKRIMNTKVPAGAITSLNGMRVLSMWWVILGHTFVFMQIASPVMNIQDVLSALHRFTFAVLLSGTFSVDSFFFISGLLVSYLSLREMEKRGKLPLWKYYFHRFWRLTPVYMFALLFYAKLSGFLGQGPMWFVLQSNPPCDKYWWTNLLYINNFYPENMNDSCMGWAWYLANDMQFYVISPIILYAIYKLGVFGFLGSVGTLFIAHFITTGCLIGHYNLDTAMNPAAIQGILVKGKTATYMKQVYSKPWCRIGTYLVGISLGYLLHRQKERTRRLPKLVVIAGWSTAITLGMLVVYGPYSVYKEGGTPFNMAENITYGTFSRTVWGLALAWVIYACHQGYGGLVNDILSARFWIPLSRLTYGAYLLHPVVLLVYYLSGQTTVAYSDIHVSFHFVSTVVMTYASSFILAVGLEFPTMQLERILFKSRVRHR